MVNETPDLVVGKEYSKKQLEKLFGIKFGYQIIGIVIRKIDKSSNRRLILLFQRSGGPYPDVLGGDGMDYFGAGLRGDQSLSGVNKVLADRGPVDGAHSFHQSKEAANWTYLGRGLVRYVGEDRQTGRKLLRYEVAFAK